MLHLKPISDATLRLYIKEMRPGLIRRITKGRSHRKQPPTILSESVKAILIPRYNTQNPDYSVIDDLLTAGPVKHFVMNEALMKKLNGLPAAERVDKKTLEIIFNYEGEFGSNNKERAYWLAKKIERNTCTYCNRQYVFTVERVDDNGRTISIARPVFDHWLAKSDYPLLSLNIYNLIPSCTTCNSSVKGTTPMSVATHVHPYIADPEASKFTFRATKRPSVTAGWELKIDRIPGSKIDRTINDMAIEEIYKHHADLEVKDIMDFAGAYNDDYLHDLIDNLFRGKVGNLSPIDAYRILFGVEYEKDMFLDRPFSKLKHDILKQIGIDPIRNS